MRVGCVRFNAVGGNLLLGSYLIFAGGAVLGAVGSLVFISRSLSPSTGTAAQATDQGRLRRIALSITLGVYMALALLASVVGLALGAIQLAIIAATLLLMAGAGLIAILKFDLAGATSSSSTSPSSNVKSSGSIDPGSNEGI
jgi:hypothetical protein